jgi:cyanate permease
MYESKGIGLSLIVMNSVGIYKFHPWLFASWNSPATIVLVMQVAIYIGAIGFIIELHTRTWAYAMQNVGCGGVIGIFLFFLILSFVLQLFDFLF